MALTQISTAGVKDDAVTAGKIPANAVGSSELADNAVDTNAIAANAVTNAKIADGQINSAKIVDGSIATGDIADNAVTGAKIANDTVTAVQLAAGAADVNVILNGAVTAAKLASGVTDLSNDTSPQLGGDLASNGNDILMADNDKLFIGTGQDLHIWHNGTNSYITSNNGYLQINAAYNEIGAKLIPNGAVELYHDNSKKFETSTTGATVTGTVVADNTAGRNMIINGDMRIAQRATSKGMSDHGATYDVCDRWIFNRHGVTSTIAQVNEVPDGSGFTKSFKITTSSAVGSIANGNMISFNYRIEAQDVKRLGYGHSDAKTATLSFWVRGSLSGKVGVSCTRDSKIFSANEDIVANTWKFVEIVIPADTSTALGAADTANGFGLQIVAAAGGSFNSGPTNGNWIGFHTAYTAGMTAAQMGAYLTTNGSTFQITGVQFELGSKATAFEHEPIADQLLRCQRYYENIKGAAYQGGLETLIANGFNYQTNRVIGNFQFKAQKRATPSVSTDDASEVQALKADAGWYSAGSFGGNSNVYATRLDLGSMPNSPMVEGQGTEIRLLDDGRIHFSSEL